MVYIGWGSHHTVAIYWAEAFNSVHDAETPSTSSYSHNVYITPECNMIQEGWAKKE